VSKGVVKLLLNPTVDKSGDSFEAILPDNIAIINCDITPLKNMTRRWGYEEAYATGELSRCSLVIDVDPGYAVMENGWIYRLDTLVKLTTKMIGKQGDEEYHPQFEIMNGMVIIADGGDMVKIQNGDSSLLGGNPPKAKFIGKIGDRIIVSGYKDADGEYSEVSYCSNGNPEEWLEGDSGFFSICKNTSAGVKMMKVNASYVYFFKEKDTEVFSLVGGDVMFQRHDAACFDIGIKAPYSLVKSLNSLLWLGHTGDIYELAGGQPQIISIKYKQMISELNYKEELLGFDFYKEYKIRWLAQTEGKCIVYDYLNKLWSEENTWDNNDFQRMPFNSMAYINDECYVGSYIEDGKIYRLSKDVATDNGLPIRCVRQFRLIPFMNGDTRGTIDKIDIRVKRGVATASETTPQLEIDIRTDYGEWVKFYIDLGINSDQDPYKCIYPGLYGSEFEFKIIETDAIDYLMSDMTVAFQGNS